MKIFQINASYKPAYIYGGPTMSVAKLSEQLIKEGINTEVFTTTANGEKELEVKAGSKILVNGVSVTYFRRLTKDNSHFSPVLLISLWKNLHDSKSLRNDKSDESANLDSCTSKLVHIHAWWNLVSVGSCLITLLSGKSVILSPRGTLSHYSFGNRKSLMKSIFHKLIGKNLLKRCHFHVSTEKEKQDILNIIVPKTITVIPNFVELGAADQVMEAPSIKGTTFKLLFISRIEEKKGLNILFNAMQQLTIPFHLTIAGSGNPDYIRKLKTLASRANLTEHISWIGHQKNSKKFSVLAGHDLMILPSHDESFANVVIESLSVGTPVLVSNKVGLSDYILKHDLGWVSALNENELSSVISKAYKDLKFRINIRSNARSQISKDYNDRKLLGEYMELYKESISQ